tara:strand:+ start:1113 stop:1283 length:171 start_codon:yes stop_codon:yes gene_type:complete
MLFLYHVFEVMIFMAFVIPYTAFLVFLCAKIMDISLFIGDKVVNFVLKILGMPKSS